MGTMGVNGQRKAWPNKLADSKPAELEASWDALSEGARLVEPSSSAPSNGSARPTAVAPNGDASAARGGASNAHLSPSLKHLSGSSPAKEWAELCLEEERLLDRLQRVVAARGRLELHMAIAGTIIRRTVQADANSDEAADA